MDNSLPEGFQLDQPSTPTPDMPATPANSGVPEGFQLDEAKYSGAGQAVQAGVEGALSGTIGHAGTSALLGPGIGLPGAPGMKTGFNIASPEAIRGRAEAHPIASTAGEIAGLGVGALTGTGEAAALESIGKGTAEAIGLGAPVRYAARVGSSAAKSAAEMAAFQMDDEVAKAINHDPNFGAQSAIANVGLATALGAGGGAFITGAVSPLWQATKGMELTGTLKNMIERLGGREGEAITGKAADLEATHGVPIAPELKAVIDQEPGAMGMYSVLNQTDHTWGGRNVQAARETLETGLNNKILETLGHSPETASKTEINPFQRGREAGETLVKEIEPATKEISKRYDEFGKKFKDLTLNPQDRLEMAEQIAQKAVDEGWHKAESDTQQKLASNVMSKLNSQATIDDLKKYLTNLYDAHPYGSPTYKAAKDIGRIIKEQQEKIILGKLGGEELTAYQVLRKDYSKMMDVFDNLNEHLHVGRYDGPQSFLTALKDLNSTNAEGVLNRLSGKNKADVLERLKLFPETLSKIKQFHIDSLLEKAGIDTTEGTQTSIYKLLNHLDKMTPETRNLILSPEQQGVIAAARQTMAGLKDPTFNYSKTGRTMAKLMHDTPSVISFIAALMGHAEAGMLGFLGKLGFSEGKDAVKLGMLKLLGSDKPIDAAALKSAITYFDKAQKGAKILSKASENVFKPGVRVLVSSQMPTAAEITKLDKLVASNDSQDTSRQLEMAGNSQLGHYLPDHQTAISQSSFQSLDYLKTLKPKPVQNSPFDTPIEPTPEQEGRYRRALEIAQQPAVVLQHIKDGTIVPSDVQDIKSMYPALYDQLSHKLTSEMIDKHSNEEPIPYKTRLGMSMFLGQPMDSTMNRDSITAAQLTYIKPPPPQQPKGKKAGDTSKLGKDNKMYKTPTQASESDRASRD